MRILICDDDDYFTNGALSTINKYWAKYKKDEVGGLIAYRGGVTTQVQQLEIKCFRRTRYMLI